MMYRRTYGQDTGEDIREGYEPADEAAIDEANAAGEDEFTVGEDDEGQTPQEEPEETSHWRKESPEPALLLKPKYGLDGEEFENVWGGGGPSQSPHENP